MRAGVDACVRRGQARVHAASGCVMCVCVAVCARRGTVRHVAAAAPGVRRSWLRVGLCSRTVSGSLLPVHYTSEHRSSHRSSSAVAAAVAARVTGQEGLGDTQLVERGTITNDLGCQGAIRLALI